MDDRHRTGGIGIGPGRRHQREEVQAMTHRLRLGINVDHVATLRNARGGTVPDPVRAAHLAARAGADGITAHLREDRRHIRDNDIERLMAEITLPLNMEMAATPEMLAIALRHKPHATCIVPERREERTTEGGLNAAGMFDTLKPMVAALNDAGVRVSLFIAPEERQLEAAVKLGAPVVELHTGAYCDYWTAEEFSERDAEFQRLQAASRLGGLMGLEVHAGHGLNYENVGPIAALPEIRELNIGHYLMGEAIFVGLEASIQEMRRLMDEARTAMVG
jgi:pyridoxine 5-phosphate synthase